MNLKVRLILQHGLTPCIRAHRCRRAGYMGGGIAQVFAMTGIDVVIVDADPIPQRVTSSDFSTRLRTSRTEGCSSPVGGPAAKAPPSCR